MNRDQALLDIVGNQRNNNANEAANLAADLVMAKAHIEDLEGKVASLEAEVATLKPAEAPKE